MSSVRRPRLWVFFQDALLFHCKLYTDCPGGYRASREPCSNYLLLMSENAEKIMDKEEKLRSLEVLRAAEMQRTVNLSKFRI